MFTQFTCIEHPDRPAVNRLVFAGGPIAGVPVCEESFKKENQDRVIELYNNIKAGHRPAFRRANLPRVE